MNVVDASTVDGRFFVLVDKHNLTAGLKQPDVPSRLIMKPTKEEYDSLVNGFFWDATYIAKYLWRDEIYFAKYMFDSLIRFEHLLKVVEWYVGVKNDWRVIAGLHGRFLKRHLDAETWAELEETFADANVDNNWDAFFKMLGLFRRLANYVATELGYEYPAKLDEEVTSYCLKARKPV